MQVISRYLNMLLFEPRKEFNPLVKWERPDDIPRALADAAANGLTVHTNEEGLTYTLAPIPTTKFVPKVKRSKKSVSTR